MVLVLVGVLAAGFAFGFGSEGLRWAYRMVKPQPYKPVYFCDPKILNIDSVLLLWALFFLLGTALSFSYNHLQYAFDYPAFVIGWMSGMRSWWHFHPFYSACLPW